MYLEKGEIPEDLLEFFEPAGCGKCYVCRMVAVFRDVRRVLHDSGCVFLNLGDSYASGPGGPPTQNLDIYARVNRGQSDNGPKSGRRVHGRAPISPGLKPKDLMLVPQRVAIALQQDGWTIRSQIPWVKRNSMPESVEDRPSSSVEYVFLMTKKPAYFYDADAVRRPNTPGTIARLASGPVQAIADNPKTCHYRDDGRTGGYLEAAGRNRRNGDWWFESVGMLLNNQGDPLGLDVNPAGFPGAHFATWPSKLVEPMIFAGTSARGCCPRPGCGAPWVRTIETGQSDYERLGSRVGSHFGRNDSVPNGGGQTRTINGTVPSLKAASRTLKGWEPSCSCPPADPIPCTVLDIFNGSGTTGVVALAHGRRYVGLDLSPEYLAMARRRIERPHARIRPVRDGAPLPLFDAIPEDEHEEEMA